MNVVNSEVVFGVDFALEGTATQNNPDIGELCVCFGPSCPTYNCVNYNVLDTDYNSYSYVWSCDNIGDDQSTPILYILNRSRDVSQAQLDIMYAQVSEIINGFDPEYPVDQVIAEMVNYSQENCSD